MKRMIISTVEEAEFPQLHLVFEYKMYNTVTSSIQLDTVFQEYGEQLKDELTIDFETSLQAVKDLIELRGYKIDMESPSPYKGSISTYLWIHDPKKENELLGSIFAEGVIKHTNHSYTLKDGYGNTIYDKNGNHKRDLNREREQLEYFNNEGKRKVEDEILKNDHKIVTILNPIPTVVFVDGKVSTFRIAMTNLDEFIDSLDNIY